LTETKYCKDFGRLLDLFSEQVRNKLYKKMPYDAWRNLASNRYAVYPAILRARDWCCVSDEIEETYTIDFGDLTFEFEDNDHSFGAFLANKWNWNDLFTQDLSHTSNKTFIDLGTCTATAAPSYASLSNALDNLSYAIAENQKSIMEINGDLIINKQHIKDIIDESAGYSIRKENDDMNILKNFDFGPCTGDKVKLSLYGLAVQNSTGTWVSYDPASGSIIDVDILNFEGGKFLYKMPVAIKDIKVGDMIIHNRKPMYVTALGENKGTVSAIDPAAGEEKVILCTKSPFGFDFITRVVNLFDGLGGGASADTPFGNMLPLMLLSGDGKGSDDLLPFLLMNKGSFDMSNPLALYCLMGGSKNRDLLPLMLMGGGNLFGTPAVEKQ
jgi:hypothetical protein